MGPQKEPHQRGVASQMYDAREERKICTSRPVPCADEVRGFDACDRVHHIEAKHFLCDEDVAVRPFHGAKLRIAKGYRPELLTIGHGGDAQLLGVHAAG